MRFKHWIFSPRLWSRLGSQQVRIDADTRRHIVFSQVLTLALFGMLIHFAIDTWRGDYGVVIFVLLTAAVTGLSLYLNERQYHRTAKRIFFGSVNVTFFVLAALVPRTCAVDLLLVSLMGLALVVHGQKDFGVGLAFAAISLISLLVLEFTDYQPLGDIRILEKSSLYNSIINTVSACVTLLLSIVFLVNQSYRFELSLVKRENQLSRTNAKLDRVVYSASHDLRAPLNSIKGLINVASKEKDSIALAEYFKLMENRIIKLDNFILDILELSRSEKAAIVHENLSVKQLVEEVANSLRYMEGAEKIALMHDFGHVDFVHTDRKRLSMILNNLIANAIKYQHSAREQAWVKIHAARTESHLQLTIRDNGQGIAREHQPRVFEMFYRATATGSGSGLGLFLVKEAVEQLEGSISLHSEYGIGTTFTISLPLN